MRVESKRISTLQLHPRGWQWTGVTRTSAAANQGTESYSKLLTESAANHSFPAFDTIEKTLLFSRKLT